MIIDHPEVFREASSMDGVYFTHDGADNVVTEISDFLDHYSKDYARYSEKAWREEYDHE